MRKEEEDERKREEREEETGTRNKNETQLRRGTRVQTRALDSGTVSTTP